jgi:tetratricopeptide (TPR) repeat protein
MGRAPAGFHLGVSATDWWFTQAKVLLMYLQLAVWPWPLSIHYEPPYLTSLAEAWMYVVPVACLVAATLVLLWRRSAVGFLGTFALAILAPTLVVPIVTEIAAERRMYLPLAALVTLVVVGGYVALRHALAAKPALAAVATFAVLLACVGGVVSSARLAAYADNFTLWQDVLVHDPTNATAQYNIGTIFLERGEPQRAIAYFERSIELRPQHPPTHHNLGAALAALGRHKEATQEFERAVELEPGYALGHLKLAITAMNAGRIDEAKRRFEAVLQLQPHNADAHRGLAGTLLADGKLADAIHHARAALDVAPEDAESHNLLGAALAQQGQIAEAVEQFEAAVRLDPTMLQALGNLMAAYGSLGRSAEAIATAEQALELAQASGDTAFEQQINTFLEHYRTQSTGSPSASSTGPSDE